MPAADLWRLSADDLDHWLLLQPHHDDAQMDIVHAAVLECRSGAAQGRADQSLSNSEASWTSCGSCGRFVDAGDRVVVIEAIRGRGRTRQRSGRESLGLHLDASRRSNHSHEDRATDPREALEAVGLRE